MGACGWILSNLDGSEWIKGGGIIHGFTREQISYRSELGQHLGVASFGSLVTFPGGKYVMKTVCDGLSTLKRVSQEVKYTSCSSNHVNMTSIITDIWDKSDFSFTKEHVVNKYEQGLSELSSIYTAYFTNRLAFILQKPTAYLKQ